MIKAPSQQLLPSPHSYTPIQHMPDDSHDGTEPVKDFRRVSVGGGLEKDIEVTEDGTLEKSPTGHDRMMSASVASDSADERRLM